MKYLNAALVLPGELVEELQKYVEGDYLYVPSCKNRRRKWGERSGFRLELMERNKKIRQEFPLKTWRKPIIFLFMP